MADQFTRDHLIFGTVLALCFVRIGPRFKFGILSCHNGNTCHQYSFNEANRILTYQ
jgi:hypothetical protein